MMFPGLQPKRPRSTVEPGRGRRPLMLRDLTGKGGLEVGGARSSRDNHNNTQTATVSSSRPPRAPRKCTGAAGGAASDDQSSPSKGRMATATTPDAKSRGKRAHTPGSSGDRRRRVINNKDDRSRGSSTTTGGSSPMPRPMPQWSPTPASTSIEADSFVQAENASYQNGRDPVAALSKGASGGGQQQKTDEGAVPAPSGSSSEQQGAGTQRRSKRHLRLRAQMQAGEKIEAMQAKGAAKRRAAERRDEAENRAELTAGRAGGPLPAGQQPPAAHEEVVVDGSDTQESSCDSEMSTGGTTRQPSLTFNHLRALQSIQRFRELAKKSSCKIKTVAGKYNPPKVALHYEEDMGGVVKVEKLVQITLPAVPRGAARVNVKEFLKAHTARLATKIENRVPLFNQVSRDQLLRVLRQVVLSQLRAFPLSDGVGSSGGGGEIGGVVPGSSTLSEMR